MSRLRKEQANSNFTAFSCDLSDLETLLEQRQRLGKGEISTIAFAMKFRQAVLTDDQKAKRLATDSGHEPVQTTPHLFSWLIYGRWLADSDKDTVISQHRDLDGILEKYLEDAYILALQYRATVV